MSTTPSKPQSVNTLSECMKMNFSGTESDAEWIGSYVGLQKASQVNTSVQRNRD